MKVNNYLVTGADLATMGYVQKSGTTPPLDGNIMNKGEANANYYIDQSATPWSTYPDTRAPKYQDFPCPCLGEVTVYNDLVGAIDHYVQYQDCSGNAKSVFIAAGTAVVLVGCTVQDPGGYTGCGILRGSIFGINLRAIEYGNCCPGNTPCTTTSTTTIYIPTCNYNGLTIVCNTTTTTTTTAPPSVTVSGVNNFFAGEIQDITVNGTTISGVSFPVNIGDGFSGTTSFSGVQTVQVYVRNVSPNGCVTISADTFDSFNVSGDATSNLTSNINGGVYIDCTDGSCP